jgi:hypothetical protein
MTAWFVYIERKLEIRMKINKDDLNEGLLNKLKKLETYIESLGSLRIWRRDNRREALYDRSG